MKILITGSAGFTGFHLVLALTAKGDEVVGIDNINDHYDIELKHARLRETGIDADNLSDNCRLQSYKYPNYHFIKADITRKNDMLQLFAKERPDTVCHLAAQAGVRYSLENPEACIQNNVCGFSNILEACRYYPVRQLLYASSSSVYGSNRQQPYGTEHRTDHPVSIYAATKKMNELMAHTYSYLYGIPTVGLRFFTVYGPWGRPDMAPFIFAKNIMDGTPVRIYNHGNMYRDFTYIDDIVQSISLLLDSGTDENTAGNIPYYLYNIGNSRSVCLMDFIKTMEDCLGIKAIKTYLPMQDGDMISTLADISGLEKKIRFRPAIPMEEGVKRFIDWFRDYYRSRAFIIQNNII
jgi:UDP-glucuronate 4-epimerase